jgi:hypothetical protein
MYSNAGRRTFLVGLLGTAIIIPLAHGQDLDQVKASMAALKGKATQLGTPTVKGSDNVAGKDVAALYFGTTKMIITSMWSMRL